jgi:gamma-glutamyltranspeptidase
MYDKRPEQVQVGGLAVGVPGEIKGFELMHRKYGKLPWSKLFAPSAKLCKDGFRAGTELVRQLNLAKGWILENEEFRKVYVKNGELVDVDDIVKRPELGATLEKIGKEGSSAFYEGEIAREIVDFTQKNGGILTLQDLKNYKPIIRPYAEGKFFNSTIISTTAPSGGSILISTLQLLEEVIKTKGKGSTADVYHKFVESLKFGFAMRTKIADPDFDSEISKFSELILTKDYIKNLATEVDLTSTHNFDYYHPQYDTKELPGTTHISVIDNSGLVVSLTSTVNLEFGSHLMTPLSGIILNDEMDDFSLPNVTNGFNLPPSPLNWVQPHKRPLSSTVPTIVVGPNGDIITLGGSGGTRILSAVAQILLEVEVNGKDLNSAIDTPRIHHQLIPETIFLEKAFDQDIINGLYTKGHNVTRWPRHKSVVQIVKRSSKDGSIEALSDGRKHGLAYVY